MNQQTLAMAAGPSDGLDQQRRFTRRDTFLATMEKVVPWQAWGDVTEPQEPKIGSKAPQAKDFNHQRTGEAGRGR